MKYIVSIIFILYFNCCFSQNLISGSVKDSSGNYIESAVVRILIKDNKFAYLYSLTNYLGVFEINIPDSLFNHKAIIAVQAFGFFPQEKTFNYEKTNNHFILQSNAIILTPVTVKDNEVKIRKKGDTLSFSTATFSSKADKTIGDVLKKIPGIELDHNGRISFNGTPINYFYIDGDNLLDDRYTIATESIPYDIVDKIQVIEKNQHIKMLSGVIESDKPGINITLKEKNKINWINNASIGLGFDNLSLAEINSMIFKSRVKSLNVLKYNNIGKNISDELITNAISSANTNADIVMPNSPIVLLGGKSFEIKQQRYLFNNSIFLSSNSLVKNKNGFLTRFNFQNIVDKQNQTVKNLTNFTIPNNNSIEISEKQVTSNEIKYTSATLGININSSKRYLNISADGSLSPNTNLANITLNNTNILQNITEKKSTASLLINGIFIIGTKRFVEFFSETKYVNNPQNLIFIPGLFDSILNAGNPFKSGNQQLVLESIVSKNYFSLRYVNGNWLYTIKTGINLEQHQLSTSIYVDKLNGETIKSGIPFTNHIHFNKYQYFLENETQWQHKNSKLIFNIPLAIHKIDIADYDQLLNNKNTLLLIQPNFQWNKKMNSKIELKTRYLLNNQFGDIFSLNRGVIIADYRELAASNLNYLQTQNELHQLSTTFLYKNPIKIFFLNFSVQYSFQQNHFIQFTELNSNLNRTLAIPFINSNKTFFINTSISKYLFFVKTTLNIAYRFRKSTYPLFQNKLLFNTVNTFNATDISLRSKITNKFSSNVELSFTNIKNFNSTISMLSTQQFRHQYSLEYYLNNNSVIKLAADGFNYWRSGTRLSSIIFFDASAKFFIRKPNIELEAIFSNVSNMSEFTETSIQVNSISTEQSFIRGRTAFVKINFNF